MPTGNVTKGKELVLLIRNDADTLWQVAGGVKDRDFTINNPSEDTTSSSTPGEYSEKEFTGYSDVTLNASGVVDNRTGVADPVSGFTVINGERLTALATTGSRLAKLKLLNTVSGGYIEGDFIITSFGKSGSSPGLLNFQLTAESNSDVSIIGDV